MPPTSKPQVVLIGAGHAHLHLIRHARQFTDRGHALTLIAPEPFWYSGLATGVLGGQYPPELDLIDPTPWLDQANATWIKARVTRIHPIDQILTLDNGHTLAYTAASLDVGSEVPVNQVPGLAQYGIPVKPVRHLVELREELQASADNNLVKSLVVAGAGDSGCEIAANLAALRDQLGLPASITLLASGPRILPRASKRAARHVTRSLNHAGVLVLTHARLNSVEPNLLTLQDGRTRPFTHLIAATGLAAPAWLAASRLPTDDQGALRVTATLQCETAPTLLAAGDCAAFTPRPLPRVGVHAVRQAPVLLHNLLALLENRPLRPYRPQRRCLLIMNLGDGTALATWGPFHAHGHWPLKLKEHLDLAFLNRHRPP